MTTYTSSENLRSYHHLKGEARKKAFKNMKGMYLEKQFPDFIQEMKATLDTMGISIKEYEFGWDCARLWLEYRDPKRDLSYIKGVRAYSFIENNMLNCCQKREYRMKVYDRWNQPWSVYHGMNMIVRLSDKNGWKPTNTVQLKRPGRNSGLSCARGRNLLFKISSTI